MKHVAVVLVALAVVTVALTVIGGLWPRGSSSAAPSANAAIGMPVHLPMAFIENRGQWDPEVRFGVQNHGFAARFENKAVVLRAERRYEDRVSGSVVRLVFENASALSKIEGDDRQDGYYNFYIGNDPARWRTKVPGYASAVYRDLYPGIDLRVREETGWLEYDVMLEAGTDLGQMVVRCEGIQNLRLDRDGSLVMETSLGPIDQKPPVTWSALPDGGKRPAVARYRIIDRQHFGFEVPERDAELAMVIDPGLVWSTYLGGAASEAAGFAAVCVDSVGVTLAGQTHSANFPMTAGAYDTSYNGGGDAFVARLTADGSRLVWATFIGGSAAECAYGLHQDASGVVTVAGSTGSANFPTTPGAYDRSFNGGPNDGFVTRLNPAGAALIYSTFLGGAADDIVNNVTCSQAGVTTTVGNTTSADFPTTPGAYDRTFNGGTVMGDAFVTRLNFAGSNLLWSTYLGGAAEDRAEDVALQSTGEVTLSGATSSRSFPTTPAAFDTSYNGAGAYGIGDGFIARLNSTGSILMWSTYLGGARDEKAMIDVDATGVVTVASWTASPNFPVTPGAYDTTYNGGSGNPYGDAYVCRLDTAGSVLIWSTFLGSPGDDGGLMPAVQSNGDVSVCGFTNSTAFPRTPGAYDTTYNGGWDAFVSRLNSTGRSLLYSTYLGGMNFESASTIVLDPSGAATVMGPTSSTDFPVTPGAYDTTYNGGTYDLFVSRLDFTVGIEEGSWTLPEHGRALYLSTPLPNPTSRSISYSVHVARKMHVRVRAFDASGRMVQILADKRLPAGLSSFTWTPDRSKIPNGTYMLRLDAEGMSQTRKFVLVK